MVPSPLNESEKKNKGRGRRKGERKPRICVAAILMFIPATTSGAVLGNDVKRYAYATNSALMRAVFVGV